MRSLALEYSLQGSFLEAGQYLADALPLCSSQLAAASPDRILNLHVFKVGIMLELADAWSELALVGALESSNVDNQLRSEEALAPVCSAL